MGITKNNELFNIEKFLKSVAAIKKRRNLKLTNVEENLFQLIHSKVIPFAKMNFINELHTLNSNLVKSTDVILKHENLSLDFHQALPLMKYFIN